MKENRHYIINFVCILFLFWQCIELSQVAGSIEQICKENQLVCNQAQEKGYVQFADCSFTEKEKVVNGEMYGSIKADGKQYWYQKSVPFIMQKDDMDSFIAYAKVSQKDDINIMEIYNICEDFSDKMEYVSFVKNISIPLNVLLISALFVEMLLMYLVSCKEEAGKFS